MIKNHVCFAKKISSSLILDLSHTFSVQISLQHNMMLTANVLYIDSRYFSYNLNRRVIIFSPSQLQEENI
jgi:hypothetical protein